MSHDRTFGDVLWDRVGRRKVGVGMNRIYIAGKFEARARLRTYAETILGYGHRVVSSWLFAPLVQGQDSAVREAYRDLEEVVLSDLLILDTYDESTTGGRDVEFGVAYANGIEIWVVGPERNIFHALSADHFPVTEAQPVPWVTVLELLEERAEEGAWGRRSSTD